MVLTVALTGVPPPSSRPALPALSVISRPEFPPKYCRLLHGLLLFVPARCGIWIGWGILGNRGRCFGKGKCVGILKPIFHQAFIGRVGGDNAKEIALDTLQIFF